MTMKRQLAGATAFFVLMSGAAQAEFVAEDLWQAWQQAAAAANVELTVESESVDDATLTLKGVTGVVPGLPWKAPLYISEVHLTSYDDDTVGITLGEDVIFDKGDEADSFIANLLHEDLEIIAAREGDKGVSYELKGGNVAFVYESALSGFANEGTAQDGENRDIDTGSIIFENVTGGFVVTQDQGQHIALNLTAAKVVTEQSSEYPSLDMHSVQEAEVDGVTVSALATLPEGYDGGTEAEFDQALRDGLALQFNLDQGATKATAREAAGFFPYEMVITTSPSSTEFIFSKDVMSLSAKTSGSTGVKITTEMMPEPLELSIADFNLLLKMPMIATEQAGDYDFALRLGDVNLSENIWSMFDPAKTIERGNFVFDVGVSGLTKIDLSASAQALNATGEPPVPEVETLKLNPLLIKIAMASLSGDGDLRIDNSTGVPMPLGTVNLKLSRVSELMTALVGFGLISEEDQSMAEMLLQGFMSPEADGMSMSAKIEFKEGNAIFVNGQQIQ